MGELSWCGHWHGQSRQMGVRLMMMVIIVPGDRRTGEEVAMVWVLDGSGYPVVCRAGDWTAHLCFVSGEC